LPRGATPIDFAYVVHSEIGDHCVGAKINGRMVPLRTMLANGDQVEILTSKGQHPSPEWEQLVATGKARSRIRRFIRLEQRQEYTRLGREILERAFDKQRLALTRKALKGVLKRFDAGDIEDLYALVGEGTRSAQEVLTAVYPSAQPPSPKPGAKRRTPKAPGKKRAANAVPIRGLIAGLAVHFAKCCFPLPGDRIIGIVTTGKGVTIHTADCDTLASFSDSPERWLDVSWDPIAAGDAKQVGRIKVVLINTAGALGELATVVSKGKGNITNLKITHRTVDFFDLTVDIEVEGARHLADIVAALRANPSIASVARMRH